MIPLRSSRWAPSSPSHNSSTASTLHANPQPKQPHHLTQYTRLLRLHRRLKWKSNFLVMSHDHAAAAPTSTGEINFKLDFFEYYVLLERLFLALLGVWDVEVSSSTQPPPSQGEPPSKRSVGDKTTFPNYTSTHRFHANVLSALESDGLKRKSERLSTLFGAEDVKRYLFLAKDMRNKWKDVDDGGALDQGNDVGGKGNRSLMKGLDLKDMLGVIMAAVAEAEGIAREEILRRQRQGMEGGRGGNEDIEEFEMMDVDWDEIEDGERGGELVVLDLMEWD